jgi:hypothetical protein
MSRAQPLPCTETRPRRVGKCLLFRKADVVAWIDAQADHAHGATDAMRPDATAQNEHGCNRQRAA